MKDLNCVKKSTKYQKASYNFRLGFVLSNGPHLHKAYLVTVPFDLILAVCECGKTISYCIWTLVYVLCEHTAEHNMPMKDYFVTLYVEQKLDTSACLTSAKVDTAV